MRDEYESVELEEEEITNIDDAQHQRYLDHLVVNIRPLHEAQASEFAESGLEHEWDGYEEWCQERDAQNERQEEEREAREHEAMEW